MSNWDFGFPDRPAGHDEPRQPPGAGFPGGWGEAEAGGAPGDPGTAPYPLTYERGRTGPSQAQHPPARQQPAQHPPAQQQPPARYDPYEPWPPAPFPGDPPAAEPFPAEPFPAEPFPGDEFTGGALPGAWPDQDTLGAAPWPGGPDGAGYSDQFDGQPGGAGAGQPGASPGGELRGELDGAFGGRPGHARHGGPAGQDGGAGARRRWLIAAGVAVVGGLAGVTIAGLASGHQKAPGAAARPPAPAASRPAGQPAAGQPAARPPITLAQAKGVLASYTKVNNTANAQRSDQVLGTIETGSSYAIDAGLYLVRKAAGKPPFPPFGPVRAAYYIPRSEPPGGPRWFAVQVGNAFLSSPNKVSTTEYLVFTQAAPGGPWLNAVEPYLMPAAAAPRIAVGGDGLATAVAATSASLATAPGQLAAGTAGALDGTATSVSVPGDLADQSDQRFWRGKLPAATVTDTHAPATGTAGQAFALRTADGGALVFYAAAATLTITPPPDMMLHLTVPGLYSPAQPLTRAGLSYLDQFAAYDPPAGAGQARVVASFSGITGKG